MGHLPPHLAQVVAQLREGLKELYGDRFRDLLLYGSYARGDFREWSDVDLLLLLDGPVDTVEEIIQMEPVKWPLSLAHDVVLSVIPVSLQAAPLRPPSSLQITRSFPPSTGIWAPVVRENSGPQSSAASSATWRLVTSSRRTLFFL